MNGNNASSSASVPNCPVCGSDMFVVSSIFDFEFDWQGDFERDIDGDEILSEYDVIKCSVCSHKIRKWRSYVSLDYVRSLEEQEHGD